MFNEACTVGISITEPAKQFFFSGSNSEEICAIGWNTAQSKFIARLVRDLKKPARVRKVKIGGYRLGGIKGTFSRSEIYEDF